MELYFLIFLAAINILFIIMFVRRWKKFDPSWLVDLAREQFPDDIEFHNSLKACTKIKNNHFVNPSKPKILR